MNTNVIKTHRCGVLLIDFSNCNPQGDPDQDNRPRTDPETQHGLITAAGPKRKMRDYLALAGHPIYISRGACLEDINQDAAASVGHGAVFDDAGEDEDEDVAEAAEAKHKTKSPKKAKKEKSTPESSKKIFGALADKFIDFKLFGGTVPRLVGTGRGPFQFTMGMSVDIVSPQRMGITRVAVATRAEADQQGGANRGMGGLWYLPYGLYRFHWYVSPHDAARTGLSEKDYDLGLEAMTHMFDNDRSSTRASGCVQLAYEFTATDKGALWGERLLRGVRVQRSPGVAVARSFDDYTVDIHPSILQSPDLILRKIVDKLPATPEAVAAE
jgi:CRISPR-associated protein Csd2